jgi:amino acid transporter
MFLPHVTGWNHPVTEPSSPAAPPELHRGLGVVQATALNIANMVGIGPFITIPMFLAAMGGPQALIAWVVAALLVLCDGLVWSELGAAIPGSGGSYHFLSQVFGGSRLGRLIPFLFIWQFLVTSTLEMASGYIGSMDYLNHALPQLEEKLRTWHVPGGSSSVSATAALLVALLLCRNIHSVGRLGLILCGGTLLTVTIVIVAGIWNFNPALIEFPENALRLDRSFLHGLGGAMLIAIYDYLGYYNICHLGDEVVNPGRTIPRAVMLSIVAVAAIYLTMNVAIIGVVPWQQAMQSKAVGALFMERIFGRAVADTFIVLILWTVAACMFSILLGYSRIPYAAASAGGFFRIFAVVHPVHRYPVVSLLSLGALTAVFCYFPLQLVIEISVAARIVVQFVMQIAALHLIRTRRPDITLPFRMWLYPLPSALALIGWLFVFVTSEFLVLCIAGGIVASGCAVYVIWQLWERRHGSGPQAS